MRGPLLEYVLCVFCLHFLVLSLNRILRSAATQMSFPSGLFVAIHSVLKFKGVHFQSCTSGAVCLSVTHHAFMARCLLSCQVRVEHKTQATNHRREFPIPLPNTLRRSANRNRQLFRMYGEPRRRLWTSVSGACQHGHFPYRVCASGLLEHAGHFVGWVHKATSSASRAKSGHQAREWPNSSTRASRI